MTASRSALRGSRALACAFACQVAWAQPPAPLAPAAASAAERAQQQTDRTMYWIRVLAAKPAPTKAAPRPVAAAPVPQARPPLEAREKIKVAAAPAPVAARTSADAASPAPAPVAPAVAEGLSDPAADAPADALAFPAPAAPEPGAAPPPAEEPDPGLVRVKLVQPDFPTAVVNRIRKGSVEVRFEVEPGGTVVDAEVVKSPHAGLGRAAVEAVKQWRFQPTAKSHTALVNLVFDVDK